MIPAVQNWVIVHTFLASYLQKPIPPLAIDIKDICLLLTGVKS